MPRYRMLYSKDGPARFISHLDLVRTFERVIRRADIPAAFSMGFNPHSIFSFAAPLQVGIGGESEYLDILLKNEVPPEELYTSIGSVLPEGLCLKEVWRAPDDSPALMSLVEWAEYKVKVELEKQLSAGGLEGYIDSFLKQPGIVVRRKVKKGRVKNVDIRPGIYDLGGFIKDNILILRMKLKTGSSGSVRPGEVLDAFLEHNSLAVKPVETDIVRTGVFPV
ncbi:MAG: hypothetical protein XD84_0164 [Desulfotomaculum sp. 46_80]|nr:MAG: hypothetical protein XD84_0164 [Desulfotomaculum sp. 46_80]